MKLFFWRRIGHSRAIALWEHSKDGPAFIHTPLRFNVSLLRLFPLAFSSATSGEEKAQL